MTIEVGDVVVWREGLSKPGRRNMPIGVANCRVLEIGVSQDNRPAARIKLPVHLLPGDWPETVNVLVADLEKDNE